MLRKSMKTRLEMIDVCLPPIRLRWAGRLDFSFATFPVYRTGRFLSRKRK